MLFNICYDSIRRAGKGPALSDYDPVLSKCLPVPAPFPYQKRFIDLFQLGQGAGTGSVLLRTAR